MSNFDGKGPRGMGVGSGRGFGPCLGFGGKHECPFCNRGLGKFFHQNWPESKDDRLKVLANYRQALEEELEDIRKMQEEINNG